MAHEGLHEAEEELTQETLDMHRALISLQEELEAVDWYRQRSDACRDSQLKDILLHNMREEIEHSAMLVEWLRRHDSDFDMHLHNYVFTEKPIVEVEQGLAEDAHADDSRRYTIGALKE